MTPISFPFENPLYPGAFRDFGLMAWSEKSSLPPSSTNATNDQWRPDAIWLEATHPSSGRPQSIRLSLSRQGLVIGDLRWSNSPTPQPNQAPHDLEISITGPVFGKNAVDLTSSIAERAELLERTWNMAQSLSSRMKCVLCLDAVSLGEVRRFAKTEGAAFSQADQIAKLQTQILGQGDQSLYDHQALVRTARAYVVAKGSDAVDEMVTAQQGGWARRLIGNLRGA